MSNLDKKLNPREKDPDIFHAAETNDVEEMFAALAAGQSLSTPHRKQLDMTPVHIAAAKHSNDFLAAAAQQEGFDPWITDANERVAMDHAQAFNNQRGMQILYDSMYDDLKPDPSRLDYTDNEPSEFYL